MTLPILTLQIRLAHDAVYARQKAREIAELLGFDRNDQTRIATAVSEIARNAWEHAGGGSVEFSLMQGMPQIFQVRIRDDGPGISDPDAVLEGSGSAGLGPGKSVAGARSVMDFFSLQTEPGAGTLITMGKAFPAHAPVVDAGDLERFAGDLAARAPQTPLEELHRQNQDLLQTLQQIREQQSNWERLYWEMETTNRDMLAVHDELSDRNQALTQSEARFRLMVEEVKDYAIFLLNAEGAIVTWNIGAERILGYTEAEIVGGLGHRIFSVEERDQGVPEREMQAAAESGRVQEERWHLRKDGSRFWASSVMTALPGENELIGYVKILRDITEFKLAQDALQAAYQRERQITKVLQSPLLEPVSETAFSGVSISTFYESALDESEVGGDFCDVFRASEEQVVFAVGDASGKGLTSALRAMQVKEVLRASFTLLNNHFPAEVLTQLNRYLCEATRHSSRDDYSFVTLALVVLNPCTGNGIYVSAGCEPPLIIRTGSREVETFGTHGIPLSISTKAAYEAHPFFLSPGDTLILLTDGITEARNQDGFLGYEGFTALAQQGSTAPSLSEMGRMILEGARTFGKGFFRDDVCMLLLRRN